VHHADYELSEAVAQELRDLRRQIPRASAEQVQAVATKTVAATDMVRRSGRVAVDNAREETYLAICTLAAELEKSSDLVDPQWEVAVRLADHWKQLAN
jgi:hypothetical protein